MLITTKARLAKVRLPREVQQYCDWLFLEHPGGRRYFNVPGGLTGAMLSSGAYTTGAVNFDGTNDYLNRGAQLTGTVDSKILTISMWVKFQGGDAASQILLWTTNYGWRVSRTTADKYEIELFNPGGGSDVYKGNTTNAWNVADGWHHLLFSCNEASSLDHLYVNDADEEVFTTRTNDVIDHTLADTSVGANLTGGSKTNADIADFYVDPVTYFDFTVAANRRKFISAPLKPVDLGSDGSSPSGSAPIIFLRRAVGAAASTFATNKGSGGNFTETGALSNSTTSPTD